MDMFLHDSALLSFDGYMKLRGIRMVGTTRATMLYGYYLLEHGVSFDYIFDYFFVFRYSVYRIKNHTLMRVDLGSDIGFSKLSSIDTPVENNIACSFFLDTALYTNLRNCVTRIEFNKDKIDGYEGDVSTQWVPQEIIYQIFNQLSNNEIYNLQLYVETRHGGWDGTFIFLMFNWFVKFKHELLVEVMKQFKQKYITELYPPNKEVPLFINVNNMGDVVAVFTDSAFRLYGSVVSLDTYEGKFVNPFNTLSNLDHVGKGTPRLYKTLYTTNTDKILLIGNKFIIKLAGVTILALYCFSKYKNISLKGTKLFEFSNDKFETSKLSSIIGKQIACYDMGSVDDICWKFLNGIINGEITEY